MTLSTFVSQVRSRIPDDRISSPAFADTEPDPFAWALLMEDLVSGLNLDMTVVDLAELLELVAAHEGQVSPDIPRSAFDDLERIAADSAETESVSLAFGSFEDPFAHLSPAEPWLEGETTSPSRYSVAIRSGAYLCSRCCRPEHLLTAAFVRSGPSSTDISGRFALYSETCEDKPLAVLWSTDALPAAASSQMVPFGLVVSLDKLMVSLLSQNI